MICLNVSYIQYKTSKEGSTMGITVSHSAMLAHCHALTQACCYTEGEKDTLVLLCFLHNVFILRTWRKLSGWWWRDRKRMKRMTEPALIMMLEYAKELYLVELFGIVVFSRTSMS